MADVFISYAREDRAQAQLLATMLEEKGWSVWWDRKIIAGRSFDEVIEHELETAKSVVVLWSQHSVSSEWVKNEAAVAAERGVLVPTLVDRVKIPLEFRRKQTVDLISWKGDPSDADFQALYQSIEANIHGEIPSPIAVRQVASRFSRRQRIVIVAGTVAALAGIIVLYVILSHMVPKVSAADIYVHPSGRFERQGQVWIEYPPYAPGKYFKFKEANRDEQYIYLYDETRYKGNDPTQMMYLRLPINGGIAQWSYPNPLVWTDLYVVKPKYP